MSPEALQRWLDAYTRAWETYDPESISALFSQGAEYRWHPWDQGDDVARGRHEIVAAWLHQPDAKGTYVGAYRPLLVTGDSTVAVGTSRYYTDPTRTALESEYHNLFVLEFDPDGLCSSFTEWYMTRPAK